MVSSPTAHTLAFMECESVLIVASGQQPIDIAQFDDFLRSLETRAEAALKLLIVCGDGIPAWFQLKRLHEMTLDKQMRMAVMTDSRLAKEGLAAFERLGDVNIEGIALGDFDRLFCFLQLEQESRQNLRRATRSLARQFGLSIEPIRPTFFA